MAEEADGESDDEAAKMRSAKMSDDENDGKIVEKGMNGATVEEKKEVMVMHGRREKKGEYLLLR